MILTYSQHKGNCPQSEWKMRAFLTKTHTEVWQNDSINKKLDKLKIKYKSLLLFGYIQLLSLLVGWLCWSLLYHTCAINAEHNTPSAPSMGLNRNSCSQRSPSKHKLTQQLTILNHVKFYCNLFIFLSQEGTSFGL